MLHLALYAICLTQIAMSSVLAIGRYTVVAPGTLHSKHVYTAAVAVHDVNSSYEIKIGITGPEYNESKTVQLQSGEVKNVDFQVPALEYGEYNLTAEGVAGIEFKNTTRLHLDNWSAHVKIQTDRGIYKPGDVINFRVLFLDENLKPSQPDHNAVIWIEDAKRNRLKEFKNFEVVKGVYTNNFEVSSFPVLGDWSLLVTNGASQRDQVYFSVEKYVLPKYEVKVESTENVAVQDGNLQAIVRANYTYGKPVNGKVTLLLSMTVYYFDEDTDKREQAPTLIRTTDMVNGKAKFDLNVKEYEAFMPNNASSYYLSLTATVEEQFTGVKLNGTGGTTLWPYRYHLYCITYETCSLYKANEEFEVAYKVLHVDNTEVKDTKSTITLTYVEKLTDVFRNANETTEKLQSNNQTFSFQGHMNESSIVVFKVKLPSLEDFEGYLHFFEASIEYSGELHGASSLYEMKPPKENPTVEAPKEWFTLTPIYVDDKYSFDIGQETKMLINSSEPLEYLVYHIIGRGNVLKSERIDLPNNPKLYNLTIIPTFLMSPYSQIYVYYIDEQGNLHYDESSFAVNVVLQNKLQISLANDTVKPGDEVSLKIKTAPNSFVGLMAVDQSALNLRSNNDLEPFEFNWRLGRYGTRTPYQGGFSRYPGQYAGVVTLTNADYPYNRTSPQEGAAMYDTTVFQGLSKIAPMAASGAPESSVSGGAGGTAGGGGIVVRRNFQETWIFANIENTEEAEFTWMSKIPDTITSWVLTGFSLNEETGLGVANSTTVKTFQPFFISVRLPYSVKRGEEINIPALIFNYLEKDLDVSITLDNSDNEYEFIEPTNEISEETQRSKSVLVPANDAAGVSFMIRPKVLGKILLKFTAVSPIAADAIHKTLNVEPEGITQYANRAFLVNLRNTNSSENSFDLEFPEDVVADSEHSEFAAVGDFLGPVLNNLDNLIRLPMGCGEQVVSKMVPNYLIHKYLKETKRLTHQMASKLSRYVEEGYQQILRFRHNNGGFSSFGPSTDPKYLVNASTWLTAYALQSLHEAKSLINIDDQVFEKGLEFLADMQAENGSFIETGDIFYKFQRDHLTLTAQVLLAFAENKEFAQKYQNNIDNGFKYLLENIDKSESVFAKAISTHVLNEVKHNLSQEHAEKLKTMAKTTDELMWWSEHETSGQSKKWWQISYIGEVETTSYILMTLLDMETENEQSLLPILRWLLAQRNSFGGFWSSKDTVAGLRALIKFATKYEYTAAEMDVNYKTSGNTTKEASLKLTDDNALVYQNVELPEGTTSVNFKTMGKGAALMQISYQYNVIKKDDQPSFSLKTTVKDNVPQNRLEMTVCAEYTGSGDSSNMALLQVSLPSGYELEEENFEMIKSIKRVRNIATEKENTVLVVYFESLHINEPQCVDIEAVKTYEVSLQKPSAIVVYDYYDPSQKATEFYEVQPSTSTTMSNSSDL